MPAMRRAARSMPPAPECRGMRQAAHARALEHRQFQMAVDVVDAQDIGRAVVAAHLDVAVIRSEPLIDGLDDADPRAAETKALRHRHAAMTHISLDANFHARRSVQPVLKAAGAAAAAYSSIRPARRQSGDSGADRRIALNRETWRPTPKAGENARQPPASPSAGEQASSAGT